MCSQRLLLPTYQSKNTTDHIYLIQKKYSKHEIKLIQFKWKWERPKVFFYTAAQGTRTLTFTRTKPPTETGVRAQCTIFLIINFFKSTDCDYDVPKSKPTQINFLRLPNGRKRGLNLQPFLIWLLLKSDFSHLLKQWIILKDDTGKFYSKIQYLYFRYLWCLQFTLFIHV